MWRWEGCDIVRCGYWKNWSTDAAYRSTLTLPTIWGLILVGFVALFVKLTGEHLWATVRYIIHQINASAESQDDTYHQIQLILRNTEAESSFIWSLIKMGTAHKYARFDAYRISFVLILLAAAHGAGLWFAGGISSRFIASSNEVEFRPTRCGWMKEPPLTNLSDDAIFEEANALVVMARYSYRRSAAYSRSCYLQAGGNSTACGTYVKPTFPYTIDTDAPCPFVDKICQGSAMTVDTGFLRSDQHLGINTRPADAIWARKVITCVPLEGEKYTDGWMPFPGDEIPSSLPPGAMIKGYKFGRVLGDGPLPEYTFLKHNFWLMWGDLPYNLWWLSASVNYQGDQQRNFVPIPELQSSEADVTVIGLTNRIAFRNAVEDPFFSAKNCTDNGQSDAPCTTTNLHSFLGCQERYQFCTSDEKDCSAFTGLYGISPDPEMSPRLNPTQQAVFQLLWKVMWTARLNFQLGLIGRENLVANEYLWDNGFDLGISATLPPDHWHSEVKNWMNTTLAVIQRTVTTFARPPEFDIGPILSSMDYVVSTEDPELLKLCQKMKARSPIHMSFSVSGLVLILSLGLFVIMLNLMLPKAVAYLQRRYEKGLYKRLEWIENSGFQLQRMAAEGRGIGPWSGRDEDVPRLVESGHVFSLTAQSLKGQWSNADCYELSEEGRNRNNNAEMVPMDVLSPETKPRVTSIGERDTERLLDR